MTGEQMDHGSGLGKGLLIGGLIGVGITLLFAPKSGTELRKDVRSKANDLKNGLRNDVNRFARKLRRQTDGVLEKAQETTETAADIIAHQRDRLS